MIFAKENGFTFVLNHQIGGMDVILYGDEKMNVSDLVLRKPGVIQQRPAITVAIYAPANLLQGRMPFFTTRS